MVCEVEPFGESCIERIVDSQWRVALVDHGLEHTGKSGADRECLVHGTHDLWDLCSVAQKGDNSDSDVCAAVLALALVMACAFAFAFASVLLFAFASVLLFAFAFASVHLFAFAFAFASFALLLAVATYGHSRTHNQSTLDPKVSASLLVVLQRAVGLLKQRRLHHQRIHTALVNSCKLLQPTQPMSVQTP